MTDSVMMDTRMKSKIEELYDLSMGGIECYTVRFKDLDDAFHFGNIEELQEFLHEQTLERFYDKELRKGYFDYINENNETLRYHVESKRGTLTLLEEECLGILN
jgi:hypothetical protein